MDENGRFAYLPFLIPTLLVEYIILTLFFWRKPRTSQDDDMGGRRRSTDLKTLVGMDVRNQLSMSLASDIDAVEANLHLTPVIGAEFRSKTQSQEGEKECTCGCEGYNIILLDFETILSPFHFELTFLSYGVETELILLCTRILSFGYLCGIGIWFHDSLMEIRVQNVGWEFFTSWNLYMLSLYYFLAVICSIIGLCTPRTHGKLALQGRWSKPVRCLGCAVYLLYEVLGASAFMVTTVAFTLLDPNPTFWNCTFHLATTCSIIAELCLNRMTVTLMHLPFGLTWSLAYTIFIWLVVYFGVVGKWPYDFLDTSSPFCFLWYTGLVCVFVFYYTFFTTLSQKKMNWHLAYLHRLEQSRQHILETSLLTASDNTHTQSYS